MAVNCSGGVCSYGGTGGTQYPSDWQQEATSMGGGGFHYPRELRRSYPYFSEIERLKQMMWEYTGPEAAFVRWKLRQAIEKLKVLGYSKRGDRYEPRYEEAPIPDWMRPYIATTTLPARELPEGGRPR